MKYIPVNGYLVLKAIQSAEKSTGGIILPDSSREVMTEGTVHLLPTPPPSFQIAPGDTAVFTKHSEYRIKEDGQTYLIVHPDNVLLVKPV